MYPFSVGSLQKALRGTLLQGSPEQLVQGREIGFMRGGHSFSRRMRLSRRPQRWSCLIVPRDWPYWPDRWSDSRVSIIRVNSIRRAIRTTATHVRKNLQVPVVQVSGSAGKSTTQAMLASILRWKHPLVSPSTQNSLPGICRNLRRVTSRHGAVIVEAGMNGSGQLRGISRVLRPDILVLTSIHREHLVRLGSLQNIIAAKAEALEFLSPQGLLVINGDDPNCARLPLQRVQGRVMRFGLSSKSDVWASDIRQVGFHTWFTAHGWDFQVRCHIATFGLYNVRNALAAICVSRSLGVAPAMIAAGLRRFRPLRGRLQVQPGRAGRLCIDDWYNANPESTALMLHELRRLSRLRQTVLVLGDQERPDAPGDYARLVHYALGQRAAALRPAFLLAVGKWAKYYSLGAMRAGFPASRTAWRPTLLGARHKLRQVLRPRQLVVFKASRWIRPHESQVFSNRLLKALV